MDEHHGKSGTYEIRDGKRVLKAGSVTQPHKDGDAPRDEDGKRLDRGADHEAAAKPQSALPEPKAIDYGTAPAAPINRKPRAGE